MNYSLANDYFDKKKAFGLFSYIMLGVTVLSALLAIFVVWWIAISCVLWCMLALTIRKYSVSDEEYDNLIEAIKADVQTRALTNLGIGKEDISVIDAINTDGYKYKGSRSRVGKDGKLRTDKYLLTYAFFGKEQIHYYSCVEATTSNNSAYNTLVCLYKDIVSVATSVKVRTLEHQNTITMSSLRLTTSGGTLMNIRLKNAYQHQDSIKALRKLIKDKKM